MQGICISRFIFKKLCGVLVHTCQGTLRRHISYSDNLMLKIQVSIYRGMFPCAILPRYYRLACRLLI